MVRVNHCKRQTFQESPLCASGDIDKTDRYWTFIGRAFESLSEKLTLIKTTDFEVRSVGSYHRHGPFALDELELRLLSLGHEQQVDGKTCTDRR